MLGNWLCPWQWSCWWRRRWSGAGSSCCGFVSISSWNVQQYCATVVSNLFTLCCSEILNMVCWFSVRPMLRRLWLHLWDSVRRKQLMAMEEKGKKQRVGPRTRFCLQHIPQSPRVISHCCLGYPHVVLCYQDMTEEELHATLHSAFNSDEFLLFRWVRVWILLCSCCMGEI